MNCAKKNKKILTCKDEVNDKVDLFDPRSANMTQNRLSYTDFSLQKLH